MEKDWTKREQEIFLNHRIDMLKFQLKDPEILDKKRIEAKLEAYEECLHNLLNPNEFSKD